MKRIVVLTVVMIASSDLMAMDQKESNLEAVAKVSPDTQECFKSWYKQNFFKRDYEKCQNEECREFLNRGFDDAEEFNPDRCNPLFQEYEKAYLACEKMGKKAGRLGDQEIAKKHPCKLIMLFWRHHAGLFGNPNKQGSAK